MATDNARVTKADNGSASATKAAAASSVGDNGNDTRAPKLSICRFLVTDLQAGGGYAKNNYRIDLDKSKHGHGLYDIVSLIYDTLQKENLTHDAIYSHLWNLQFSGTKYRNGWRRQMAPDSDEYDRPPNKSDLDLGERRLLNSLEKPLENGQRGCCSGESARFEFVVENADMEVEVEPTNSSVYPRITAVPIPLSTQVEDDWITSDEQSRSVQLNEAWISYMRGENSWKRDRRTGDWIRGKPLHKCWGRDEVKIMGLLLNAGVKFKKSWTKIMQFAFVDRAETATSYQWYKLQKEEFRREHNGRNLTSLECIALSKRLSKSLLRHHFEHGVPKKSCHPWKRVEKELRKRKKIDDTTSPEEKRRMCVMFNGIY